jgi:WD40 repeat protein
LRYERLWETFHRLVGQAELHSRAIAGDGPACGPFPFLSYYYHDASWATCLAFSVDGSCLHAGFQDGTVRTWDAATGAEWPALKYTSDAGPTAVRAVGVCSDRDLLAVVGDDSNAEVWRRSTKRCLLRLGADVIGAALSPDGTILATSHADGQLREWSVSSGDALAVAGDYVGPLQGGSIVFHPDGNRLAIGSFDFVALHNRATRQTTRVLAFGDGALDPNVGFSSDGATLAIFAPPDTVIIDAATGETLRTIGHPADTTRSAFSHDGRRLVTCGEDGAIRVWDVVTGRERLTIPPADNFLEGVDAVTLALSPDGLRLASADLEAVRIWDLRTQ